MFYFHRFLRLTPALAVAILFYATLLKHMGNGPVWYYTDVVVQSCVKNWWETLLYIQNLVHTDEIVNIFNIKLI